MPRTTIQRPPIKRPRATPPLWGDTVRVVASAQGGRPPNHGEDIAGEARVRMILAQEPGAGQPMAQAALMRDWREMLVRRATVSLQDGTEVATRLAPATKGVDRQLRPTPNETYCTTKVRLWRVASGPGDPALRTHTSTTYRPAAGVDVYVLDVPYG
jgi:hypothetical protein